MENTFKVVIAFGGAAVSFLFGGWTALLNILLAFVVMDYIFGFLAAAKEGGLNSNVGMWGIAKKVAIFGIVAIAHLIDSALGESHLFRDAAIFFYLANEVLSVIENAGRIGVPIPPIVARAVELLRGKGDVRE